MAYATFLLGAIGISLSGVMAPGPITAVTLGRAARSRHAGAVIALGHAAFEFPLMLAIWLGISLLDHNRGVQAGIGLVGGVLLLAMAIGMFRVRGSAGVVAESGRDAAASGNVTSSTVATFLAGLALTAANPYFLLWWGSVGSKLIVDAVAFGLLGLAGFAVVHWLCDLGWLWLLSAAANKGSGFFGYRFQKATYTVCGVFLLLAGGKFIVDAVGEMVR